MNRDIAILREAVIKVTQMLAGMGLLVTQRGAQAYVATDPKTLRPVRVNIPMIPDNADENFIMAIQGFIDHEVAHILFTDWQVVKEAAKKGGSWDSLQNIVEDVFIERKIHERFPGSAYNLDKLHGFFIERITTPALAEATKKGDIGAQFGVLLVPLMRAYGGQKQFKEFLDRIGAWSHPLIATLDAKLPQSVKDRIPKIKDSREAWEIAQIIHAIIHPPKPPAPPPPPSECDKKDSDDKSDQKSESDGKGSNKEKPEDEEDKGSGGDADQDQEDKDDADQDQEDKDDADSDQDSSDDADSDEDSDGEEGDQDAEGDDEEDSEDQGGDADSDLDDDADDPQSDSQPDDGDDPTEDPGETDDEDVGDQEDGSSSPDEGEGEEQGDQDEPADGDEDDARGDEGDDASGDEDDGSGSDEGDDSGEDQSSAGSSDDEDGESDQPGAEDGEPDDASEGEGDGGEVGKDGSPDQSEGDGDPDDVTNEDGQTSESDSSPFAAFEVDHESFDEALKMAITDEATRNTRDADYTVFTRDFDRFEKARVPKNYQDQWLVWLDDKTRSMVSVMQKDVERMLAARSQVVKVPGYRSGRLHAPNFYRLKVNDDRIFRRKQENNSKDTAVALVIDNSGSMRGSKMTTAMTAGYALSQTLERCNIAHEVIGFTTLGMTHRGSKPDKEWGELPAVEDIEDEIQRIGKRGFGFSRMDPMYLPIYKGFDERLTSDTRRRFAAAAMNEVVMNGNIDGESVEFAVRRLLQRREARKVCIVLSDGFPACFSHDQREVHSHLHKVVKDAMAAKVDLVGIGIQSAAVSTYYPRNMVLNNVDDLPKIVMNELKRILLTQ